MDGWTQCLYAYMDGGWMDGLDIFMHIWMVDGWIDGLNVFGWMDLMPL